MILEKCRIITKNRDHHVVIDENNKIIKDAISDDYNNDLINTNLPSNVLDNPTLYLSTEYKMCDFNQIIYSIQIESTLNTIEKFKKHIIFNLESEYGKLLLEYIQKNNIIPEYEDSLNLFKL